MEQALRYIISADTAGMQTGLGRAASFLGTFQGKALAAATASSAAFLGAGNAFDSAKTIIVQGTGATGAALDTFMGQAQDLAKYGLETAADALQALNTGLGVTGPGLTTLAEHAIKAQSAFGRFDIAQLTQAMNAFNIPAERGGELIDVLGTVAQGSGAPISTLVGYMQRFGPVADLAGLSANEAANFFGNLHKGGVDVARVMPGLEMALRKAGEDGVEDLRGFLEDAIGTIQNAESDTEALRVATETFSSRGAAAMTAALRGGAIPALDELEGALGDSTDATDKSFEAQDNLRDMFGRAKNAAIGLVAEHGHLLAGVTQLAGATPALVGLVSSLASSTGVMTAAQYALNLAMSLNPIGLVVAAIGGLIAIYLTWRDEINAFLGGAWSAFKNALDAILGPLGGITGAVDKVKGAFGKLANMLKIGESPGVIPSMNEASSVMTATLIPALDLTSDAVVNAHTRIRDLAKANEFELIPSDNAVAATFIGNQVKMAEAAEAEQARIAAAAERNAGEYQRIWTQAFQSVGGLLGAMKATIAKSVFDSNMFDALQTKAAGLGERLGSKFGSSMGQVFSGAFSGLASAGISAAINLGMAGLAKLGGFLKRMFGGISDEAIGDKGDFADQARAANAAYADQASQEARFQDLIAHGWAERDAALYTFFQNQAIQSGRALAEADAQWHAYHEAMKSSDTEAMAAIEANILSWHETSADTAAENEAAWAASFDAQTVESDAMTDAAIANSARLRDAMIDHSKAILAGVKDMARGIKAETNAYRNHWKAAWKTIRDDATETAAHVTAAVAGIPDRTVRITYAVAGGPPAGGPGGGGSGAGGGGPVVIKQDAPPIYLDGRELTRGVLSRMGRETHLQGARGR